MNQILSKNQTLDTIAEQLAVHVKDLNVEFSSLFYIEEFITSDILVIVNHLGLPLMSIYFFKL